MIAHTLRVADSASSDLDAAMAVMQQAFDARFGEAWTRSQTQGMLSLPGVQLLLANAGPEPVGFALSRTVADEAELLLLAVVPSHRRRGIARSLLDAVVARSRADGAHRLHLEVRAGNPADGLYRATGFAPVGRRPAYYRGIDGALHDAVSLSRELVGSTGR